MFLRPANKLNRGITREVSKGPFMVGRSNCIGRIPGWIVGQPEVIRIIRHATRWQ